MERTILLLGDPRLYEVSVEVREEELEQIKLVKEDLRDTLLAFRKRYGVGRAIAAPQIGVRKRVIYRHLDTPVLFINPLLTFPDQEMIEVLDDCMSFPGLLVRVKRFKRCVVHYKDEQWKDCAMELEGDMSELLQHEYDHLDGILATLRAVDDKALVMKQNKQAKADKDLGGMSLAELWQLFPIFLTEYREEWALWYEEEKERLCGILPMEEIAAISHVGSTSIDGMWAKPVVDILVEMKLRGDTGETEPGGQMEEIGPGGQMAELKEILEKSGYLCMAEKPDRISFNRGYTPEGYANRVFHLHLRTAGDNDELYFRDYLREHREAAREYEALKLRLWKEYEHDRDGYTQSKTELVERYTREARRVYGDRYGRRPAVVRR